jgi:tRNA (cytidine32/uridine32-2'-O)-methyltransferase
VGAVARVVRNTGLLGLDLVEPHEWRTVECWRTAWGAQDVLEAARVFGSLAQALADAAYVVALSGRREGGDLDVREMADEVASLAEGQSAALVFGPETAGLTLAEIALCGRRARIPAHPEQPSLNLSHAVMVAAYEVYRSSARPAPASPRRATHGEKQRLLGLLREGLESVGALTGARAESYFQEWTSLVQRTDMSPDEARLVEHAARRMARFGRRP